MILPGGFPPPACLPERTRWRGGVYAAGFGLVPLLAYVWPLGFTVLVPLLSLALLPLWVRPQGPWPVALLAAALALWGFGTFGWSPAAAGVRPDDPETQFALKLLVQAPAYGFFAAAAGGLAGRSAHRSLTILGVGLLVLGGVLVLEGATAAWGYRQIMSALGEPIRPDLAERNVGKGQFVLALLAWPGLVFLYAERRHLVPLLLGLVVLCAFVLNETAPVIGFAAGGVAFLLVRSGGAWAARAVGGLLALQILLTPWLVRSAAQAGVLESVASPLPESWRQRLDVWEIVSARVAARPGLGWGLEASRTFEGVPLHPHNAALQVWAELGAVGAVLFALLWLRVFESVARMAVRDRSAAAACGAAAGAYFTIGALSYGVWQEWWLAAAAVAAAVCTVLVVARDRERLAYRAGELQDAAVRPL